MLSLFQTVLGEPQLPSHVVVINISPINWLQLVTHKAAKFDRVRLKALWHEGGAM